MSLSWVVSLLLMLLSCPSPLSTLAPENEVPLHPNTWLPHTKITPVHLGRGRTRRLYFTLRKKTTAFSITVRPCAGNIEWSLMARTLNGKPAKSQDWSSKKSEPELWWQGSGYEAVIHSYAGTNVDAYTGTAFGPSAIYTLRLKATEQEDQPIIYLHEGPGPAEIFPQLPSDPRVHKLGVGMSSVTLNWEQSPSLNQASHPDRKSHYEYCVLANHKRNYQSLCAARQGLGKEHRKGRKDKKRGRDTQQKKTDVWSGKRWDFLENTASSTIVQSGVSTDIACACKEVESVCTVSDLLPDTQYYFDVFVIDKLNGTSAAYMGTFARTHPEAPPAIILLREGQVQLVILPSGLDGRQRYSFRPRGWQQNGLFTLQSCNATCKIKVSISSRGKLLSTHEVGDQLAQIWLQGGSSYLIQLQALETVSSSKSGLQASEKICLKIQASSAYHRRAAPSMPATLQLKSFNKLRGCSSITLAWMGTEERSLYCLYRRRIRAGDERGTSDHCTGPESRPAEERVLCKYFQELDPRRAVTTAVVEGLEPGTAYTFDVYLVRRWGLPIKYHSKTVRTRREC